MPSIEAHQPDRGQTRARPLAGPALAGCLARAAGARRAVAAVPQPPRLCPADAVPQLRVPLPMPELQRLAGRAPAEAAAWPATTAGTRPSRPTTCPECGEPECLVACGPGVERIADEVAELLPEARVAIVTSDTLKSPEKAAEFVIRSGGRAIDVIVGTQLVTKGFHFPELTLVGVVDADLGLEGGDLRAAERTYQQIAQVVRPGRARRQAGRSADPDPPSRSGGDRRARRGRSRRILRRRNRGPPPRRRAAVRALGGDHRLERGRSRGGAKPPSGSARPGPKLDE